MGRKQPDARRRTCERCDTELSNVFHLCAACAADDMLPDDQPEYEDTFDCGMMHDGTCMLAGSEDCDWECPHGR